MLQFFILSTTQHSCSWATNKAQMYFCPTHITPSALILSFCREKEFVNFGFILELPNFLKSWKTGAASKHCSMYASVGWALLCSGLLLCPVRKWESAWKPPAVEEIQQIPVHWAEIIHGCPYWLIIFWRVK